MRPDDERRTIKELGFRTWLTDVFWYHYKWAVIGVAAAIAVVAVMVSLSSGPKSDAIVILATSEIIEQDRVNSLKLAIGDALGDVNGDGQIVISTQQLVLNGSGGVYSSDDSTKLMTSFLDDGIVLYFFDEKNLKIYAPPGNEQFNADLASEYGGKNGAVPLGSVQLFKDLGFTGEDELYACFKAKSYRVSKSDAEYYQNARRIMDGLTEKAG